MTCALPLSVCAQNGNLVLSCDSEFTDWLG